MSNLNPENNIPLSEYLSPDECAHIIGGTIISITFGWTISIEIENGGIVHELEIDPGSLSIIELLLH